jgi:hypothetical protein
MMEIDVGAFDRYEAAGWELVAALYERVWSPTTSQAVDSLLDAAGVEAGLRVLDVVRFTRTVRNAIHAELEALRSWLGLEAVNLPS